MFLKSLGGTVKSVSNQLFCILYIYTDVSLTQRGKQPEPYLIFT